MGFFSKLFGKKETQIANNSGHGYGRHGASHAKKSLIGWITSGKSADEDIVENIETMRARSRDLFMGAPLANGALKTMRTNVVGSGLSLNSQIDARLLGLSDEEAREWERNTEREWRLWADSVNCDAERRNTFAQLQGLVLLSSLMNGDVFVTLPFIRRAGCPYDLKVGLIEADRVCNPMPKPPNKNILGGVEVGAYGETIAYWVSRHHPESFPRYTNWQPQDWKRVLAFGPNTGRRNVLHIMADVERPAQRRGVPLLAPVIEALKQLSRYTEAELIAAVVAGMFTVFVKSENGQSPLAPAFNPGMQVDPDPEAYELGNGAIIQLAEGESIETANPGRPIAGFDAFVKAICYQIGSSLEIPYELLIKTFTASYSASRASLLEAWKMFKMRRKWLVGGFCQPVYEEWLMEAVLKGRIKAPGFLDDASIRAAWSGAEWFGDAQGQLDPQKEAQAAKIRVDEGFSTREKEAAELTGMKYENIQTARAREEQLRRESGLSAGQQMFPNEGDSDE